MKHCSTPEERCQIVANLLGTEKPHGIVSQMSREHHVSRKTLYQWKAKALQAIEEAFCKGLEKKQRDFQVERAILTLFVEGHASYRGIQACVQEICGCLVSLDEIGRTLNEAGARAKALLDRLVPPQPCAISLDEQYCHQRGEAYFNIVDARSSVVWATEPPAPVTEESWTLLLLALQERGLKWETAASDGGTAIASALASVQAASRHQRDVWHIEHEGAKVQKKVGTFVKELTEKLPTVQRQAARVALGQKPRGRNPKSDVTAHLAEMKQATDLCCGLRYLLEHLHEFLQVVVLGSAGGPGVLDSHLRLGEIEAVLQLLTELSQKAPTPLKKELQGLHTHILSALPRLLLFARDLDEIQQHARQTLGSGALFLLGWAWQHREILGPTSEELLSGFPDAWRATASSLFSAWEFSVRASSAVENWHSILRPHLAVHRGLTAQMLALLAIRHNYRIAPRGLHQGLSPLQRSGIQHDTDDWMTILGHPAQMGS